MMRSDKWRIVGKLQVPGGCLEPSITLTKSGKILCALRTSKAKKIYISTSNDEGGTWSTPRPTNIPNPNSQADVLCLQNGHLLMCCNPIEKGRWKLALVRSVDEGETWDLDNMYIIEKDFNNVVPIFMPGHPGDPTWIEGFSIAGDIFYNGAKVGTVSGEAWLWNPPMRLGEAYDQVGMVLTNTITALGGSKCSPAPCVAWGIRLAVLRR